MLSGPVSGTQQVGSDTQVHRISFVQAPSANKLNPSIASIPTLYPLAAATAGIRCPAKRYSAGNAVTRYMYNGMGLPEKATRRGTAKCVSKFRRNKGKTFLVGGVSSIYGEDMPVSGCVAAPMRLLDMQGARNASVSSHNSYIHVPCLALLAQEV